MRAGWSRETLSHAADRDRSAAFSRAVRGSGLSNAGLQWDRVPTQRGCRGAGQGRRRHPSAASQAWRRRQSKPPRPQMTAKDEIPRTVRVFRRGGPGHGLDGPALRRRRPLRRPRRADRHLPGGLPRQSPPRRPRQRLERAGPAPLRGHRRQRNNAANRRLTPPCGGLDPWWGVRGAWKVGARASHGCGLEEEEALLHAADRGRSAAFSRAVRGFSFLKAGLQANRAPAQRGCRGAGRGCRRQTRRLPELGEGNQTSRRGRR